jgi:hypothetical protein
MGRSSWTAKTERAPMTQARVLRLIACVLGTGALFTALFGEWLWHLEFILGAIIGVSVSILMEILLLIREDERRHTFETGERATIRRTRGRGRLD